MVRSILAAVLIGLACSGSALADNDPGEGEDGRFLFKHVEEGFIRLDTRNGQVAMCSRRSVGWACQPVPDERAALEAEIARLQTENGALKKELLTHGLDLPGGMKPAKPAPRSGDSEQRGQSDTNLDRVVALLEKAWRRLVDLMTNLQGKG